MSLASESAMSFYRQCLILTQRKSLSFAALVTNILARVSVITFIFLISNVCSAYSSLCIDVLNSSKLARFPLPEIAFRISSEFQTEIMAEYDGRHFVSAVRNDPSQGQAKMHFWQKMGFRLLPLSGSFASPSWLEAAKNYHFYMQSIGLKNGEYIRPVMILTKRLPNSTRDILLYDPFLDPPPPSDYRPYEIYEGFNLPNAIVNQGLREGRYPLLNAFHDASHFVLLARHPWLGKSILESVSTWESAVHQPALQRRLFWTLETLSLPDSGHRAKLIRFLREIGADNPTDGVVAMERRSEERTEAQLLAYLDKLIPFALQNILDVSGGFFGSIEKFSVLNRAFNWKSGQGNLYLSISESPRLASLFMLSRFLGDTHVLHEYPVVFTAGVTANETAQMNLSLIAIALKLVREALSAPDHVVADLLAFDNFTGSEIGLQYINQTVDSDGVISNSLKRNTRAELIKIGKQFALILEKSFHTFAYKITMEEFVRGMLSPNLSERDPVAMYLQNTLPFYRIRRLYLGNGIEKARQD